MKPIEKSDNTNIRRPQPNIVKKNQEHQKAKKVGRKYTNGETNKKTPKNIEATSGKARLKLLGVEQSTDNGEIRDADKLKILNTLDYLLNNSLWLAPNGSTSYPHNPQDFESTTQAFTTGATNTASAILTAMGASAGLGNLARSIVGGVAGSEIAPLISDNKYASLYGGLIGGIAGGGYKPAIRFIEGRLNPETGLVYAMNDALETTPAVLKSLPNTELVLPIETRTTRYIRPSRGTWNGNESIINEATGVELKNNPHAGYFELVDDIDLKTGKPNNEHSVHFKTDRSKMSNAEKMALFRSLEEQIPEGHFVSTYGTLSPGGVHGLQRFGTDFNYDYYGSRSGLLKYPPKYFRTDFFVDPRSYIAEIDIPVWRKPSKFHKLQLHVLDWINATDASTENLRKFKYANDPNLYQKLKVLPPYFSNERVIPKTTDSHKFHIIKPQVLLPDGTRVSPNVPSQFYGHSFESLSENIPSWYVDIERKSNSGAGNIRYGLIKVANPQKPFIDPTNKSLAGKPIFFGKGILYIGKDGRLRFTPFDNKSIINETAGNSFIKKDQPLDFHLLGKDAVRMFKEYGGEPIPEGSINGELLRKYVPEARERYGLVGNTDITDEEIAQALYKHVKELGGNTAAVNALGEPLLLFRGDTRPYTQLRTNHHESGGTEDNILGTLFLDRTGIGEGWGPDRYLYLANKNGEVMAPYRSGIEVGDFSTLEPSFKDGYLYDLSGKGFVLDDLISYPYWSHTRRNGDVISGSKISSDSFVDGKVNHLNAFIVRTPAVRDITNEVIVTGGKPGTPPPFSWLIPKENRIGSNLHDVRLALNRAVLQEAERQNQGLLKSNRGSFWRGEEHEGYDYFALPDRNAKNAKHILPYDLRIPRNWSDPNIYRSILPFALGSSALYGITSNRKGGKLIQKSINNKQ